MSRSRDNADAVTTVPSGVGRNMVINGGMNVAQRATSVTGLGGSDGYFTVDRFTASGDNTAGRLTMSQTADGPNGISANCLKIDCTTADTSIAANEIFTIQHKFEGQNLQRIGKGVAGAKEITVSFYVKANAAFTFGCELFDSDNTRQITKLFDTTTGWNRIELTFPADVDDGSSPFSDDNGASLYLLFWLHAGANYTSGTLNTTSWANLTDANRAAGIDSFFSSTDNNFFITGVQMEVGPVATEFEQETIESTLYKCRRYFQKFIDSAHNNYSTSLSGVYNSTTQIVTSTRLDPPMRTTPTFAFSNLNQFDIEPFDAEPTALALFDGNSQFASVVATDGTERTVGFAAIICMDSATGFFSFDSEL
jgi:hypothetical protein